MAVFWSCAGVELMKTLERHAPGRKMYCGTGSFGVSLNNTEAVSHVDLAKCHVDLAVAYFKHVFLCQRSSNEIRIAMDLTLRSFFFPFKVLY